MTRTERLLALLDALRRRRGPVTAATLAGEMAVSTRTIYRDFAKAGAMRWIEEAARGWLGSDATPAAFALFPKDIQTPPRPWAERFFNVERWTTMPRGGHFAAFEEPQPLAEDIRAFFRDKRRA